MSLTQCTPPASTAYQYNVPPCAYDLIGANPKYAKARLMKKLLIRLSIVTCVGCSPDDGPSEVPAPLADYTFSDGFETEEERFAELFPDDKSRWSNVQLADPTSGRNTIELEAGTVFSGDHALRIYASASDDLLSKADIEKGGLKAPEGSTVQIAFYVYIGSVAELENLLLADLECCSCWDPSVPDNQCPGIRLLLKRDDYLAIERGKILATTLEQREARLPRNEWVRIDWELSLSQNDDGYNRLSINGEEAIAIGGRNMPNAQTFAEEFARADIDFALREPVVYERFQVGATANPTEHDLTLFVDDVSIAIRE